MSESYEVPFSPEVNHAAMRAAGVTAQDPQDLRDLVGANGTGGPASPGAPRRGGTDLQDPQDLQDSTNGPVMRVWDATDLHDEPVRWLCRGWLPKSAVTVLAGDEGIGKSLFWVYLVAAVTTGRDLAVFGLPAGRPRTVLLVLTEDVWGEVRARLTLAGADLNHVKPVYAEQRGAGTPVVPGPDEQVIGDGVRAHDAALVVVDAWLDVVPAALQVRDTQQARAALHPWTNIAALTGAAVLLVAHTNRLSTTNTRDKLGATVALRQKARMLLFAATPDDQRGSVLYLGPDKANTAGISNAVRFDVDVRQVRDERDDDPGTCAMLTDAVDAAAPIDKLVRMWAQQATEDRRPPTAEDRARAFVIDYITQHGKDAPGGMLAAPVNDVKVAATATGVSYRPIPGLVRELGGAVGPLGKGGDGNPHVLRLPARTCTPDPSSPASPATPGVAIPDASTCTSGPSNLHPRTPASPVESTVVEKSTCPACGEPLNAFEAVLGRHEGCPQDATP